MQLEIRETIEKLKVNKKYQIEHSSFMKPNHMSEEKLKQIRISICFSLYQQSSIQWGGGGGGGKKKKKKKKKKKRRRGGGGGGGAETTKNRLKG